LPITISNCSNNYGPYQYPEKLIPLFITNLMEGKKVPVYGRGQNIRDWIFVDDHNRGVDLIIQKGKIGETYCLGGNNELANLDITKKILALMGAGEEMIEYVTDRAGHDFRYAIDFSKAKNELGWEPQVNFDEGLKQTIEWYKNNEAWWKKLKNKVA
jgi:dTDP-glucose 4,6-dehydratase